MVRATNQKFESATAGTSPPGPGGIMTTHRGAARKDRFTPGRCYDAASFAGMGRAEMRQSACTVFAVPEDWGLKPNMNQPQRNRGKYAREIFH